jgi:hypothetical protein
MPAPGVAMVQGGGGACGGTVPGGESTVAGANTEPGVDAAGSGDAAVATVGSGASVAGCTVAGADGATGPDAERPSPGCVHACRGAANNSVESTATCIGFIAIFLGTACCEAAYSYTNQVGRRYAYVRVAAPQGFADHCLEVWWLTTLRSWSRPPGGMHAVHDEGPVS